MPAFAAVLLCLVLGALSPAQVRAEEASSLTDLTLGGSVGSSIGLVSLTATSVAGGAIWHYTPGSAQDFRELVGGFVGLAVGIVTLPLWTAGGVSFVSARDGHPGHYGAALGGALLGALTYPVFALPLLIPNSDAGPISMVFGAFATVLITMPITSALMLRRAVRNDDGPGSTSAPLTFALGGRF